MIQPKTIMSCTLCTKIIMESEELDKALSQVAIENNVPRVIAVRPGQDGYVQAGIKEYGYLCEDCFKLLSQASPIKKKVHKAFKLGNSCGILIPRKWLNKKVIAVLGEE